MLMFHKYDDVFAYIRDDLAKVKDDRGNAMFNVVPGYNTISVVAYGMPAGLDPTQVVKYFNKNIQTYKNVIYHLLWIQGKVFENKRLAKIRIYF